MDSEAYNDDLEDVILFMRITNTKYIDILAKEWTIRRVYPEMSNSCIEVILQDIKSVKESYENLMWVTNFENKVNMLKIKNGNRKINKNIKTSMSNRFSLKR